MGYSECLEIAGCKIIEFKEFGSYQGDWLAFVEYNNEYGFVQGAYGSCSGCDAFYAEFDGNYTYIENGKFFVDFDEVDERAYKKAESDLHERKCAFGKSYLVGGLYGIEYYQRLLDEILKDDWFDEERKEYCEWAIEVFKKHQID